MADRCFAVVTAQPDFADALQRHLRNHLGLDLPVYDFIAIEENLSHDCDGMILAAIASAEDQRALSHLIQYISLRQLQPTVVVVQKSAQNGILHFSWVPNLTECIRWPDEADRLIDVVREFGECAFPFVSKKELPLEEVLHRELGEKTPSLAPLAERILLAARHDVTVLLTGETGTGKTYFAKLIHEHSSRNKQRFLQIPCGAVAADLVESEFFGHVRGAFTGADRNKIGKFAAVGAGTILLDEIDTLSPKHQAALLRVIETGEFEPVGSVETQKSQARILVASNITLEQAVEEGNFRSDLYYRLNVMSFHFPPLRERIQDIAPLAQSMAARFNRKFNRDLFSISPQALAALEAFPWPGNIRQLENTIQHAVLVATGPELQLQHLPETVQEHALFDTLKPASNGSPLHRQRDISERNAIQRALINNGYSRSRAADALGISRVTLYKKMKKYGLMEIPIEPSLRSM